MRRSIELLKTTAIIGLPLVVIVAGTALALQFRWQDQHRVRDVERLQRVAAHVEKDYPNWPEDLESDAGLRRACDLESIRLTLSHPSHKSVQFGSLADGEQHTSVTEPGPDGWTLTLESAAPGIEATLPAIMLCAPLAAALALALGWFYLRGWVWPARELIRASEKSSADDRAIQFPVGGSNLMRALALRLNLRADETARQLSESRSQRRTLQAAIDSLPDPVLLADSMQRIVLLNLPASRLLRVTSAEANGQRIVNVVNEASILELVENLGVDGAPRATELRIKRDEQRIVFQAIASRASNGGVLLVLRNVTDLSAAVQMKTDFVANASHELRTPISAIKVALETLGDVFSEDPAQAARCMQIIGGHLRRLEEMIRDLLDLSRAESQDLQVKLESMRAADLFSFLKQNLGDAARDKGVQLLFEPPEHAELLTFKSDAGLLNLIAKNLVENSIKFTPPDGSIRVRLECDDGGFMLEVSDTGIGIAPEHQQRIFERFYQVDPARSGSSGRGTGLGLSIVKHSIHALGGTVELQSTRGRGTRVTARFVQE